MQLLAAVGYLYVASTLLVGFVVGIPTISIKGSKLFTSDGNQFFVKGVAYQLTPHDPLLDSAQCKLDAALMKELGANSIRVYHVDPSGDHGSCMATFADAGIYLWLDLDDFSTQIEETSPHWNQTQLSAFSKVVDEFQRYENVAGFFVGNEVVTTGNGSIAAPFVKAAARDVKGYRDSKQYRKIPVGYSAADIASLRPMLQNYLACGTNASEAVDFFALNAYEWCGQSSYRLSGYDRLTADVTAYSIPIFFSETGCNVPEPRSFDDQAAIFGPDMSPFWSGAIVYEWIAETNKYGLVSYGAPVDAAAAGAPPDGFQRSGTPTPVQPDFSNLSARWKAAAPSALRVADYSPSAAPPPCPAATPAGWLVNGAVALPTLGQTFDAAARSAITAGTAATGTPAPAGSASKGQGSAAAAPARALLAVAPAAFTVVVLGLVL